MHDTNATTAKRTCMVSSHVSGPCSTCHRHSDEMHLPAGGGFYCAGCCPTCRARANTLDPAIAGNKENA